MKALVISPQPFFSPRGTPFSVYYRTLIASELGMKIDLLTYGQGQNIDIPGVRIVRIPRFAFMGDVKVGPSFLKLFLDIFIFLWAVVLLLRNHYDCVHAHEEAVFFCLFLKPIFRFKLLYDMHSSLPQQLTNFQFTKSKLLIRIFKLLEDSCLQNADAVITICPDLSDYVNNLIQNKEKHFLIENSIFEPVKIIQESIKSKCHSEIPLKNNNKPVKLPDGKKYVVYAGTLEPYQGIDILIKSFKIVVSEIPEAFLVIVGGNEDQVRFYSNLAKKNGIEDNSCFTGLVSQLMAKNYCSIASVQVSPRSGGTNTPLKVYEQLANGIPLVATNIYSHTQVLNNEVAFLVEPNSSDMALGIIEALKPNGNRTQIVTNARKLYERKYSRFVYKEKMSRVFRLLKFHELA